MESSGPFDPSNPFSASFTIINTGFVTLENVNVYFTPCTITGGKTPFVYDPQKCDYHHASRFIEGEWQNHTLRHDDQYAVTPVNIFRITPLTGADIGFVVSYEPWPLSLFSIRLERIFRFVTKNMLDGKLYWMARPADD